jgi:hypothetical protein
VSRCPQCQHENPGDAKFCLECGRRLALSCGACGTELPAGAKFCKECGQVVGAVTPPTAARVGAPPESYTPKHLAEKILTSKTALEGQRKVILAARIDWLPADDKQMLQTASVIGKDVPLVLLHAVAEAAEEAVHRGLTHLQTAEFL